MAEPQSFVVLDAYRTASAPDVEFGPTWWDRHGSIPKADDAEAVPTSREEGPDTVRLRPVKANGSTLNAGEDVDVEGPVEEDKSATAPAGFKEWSTAYVLRLAVFDMLIGAMAVAIPSLNSARLDSQEPLIVTMSLLGAIVWPATVAGSRGYDRGRIGFGNDEVRSTLRAAMGLVLVGAFGAGLFGAETFLKLAVVATPFAALMSLAVRFFAHQQLHRRQRSGVNVCRVVVVGNWAAAKQLRERLDAEPAGGTKIVGACIPTRDIVYASELGMPVLGSLGDAAHVVKEFNCDAVAVTSDDTTRHGYLRRLSWSLEGAGVEMFVDPGLVEVAGARMHIRPHVGLPLLHIEEPHFTGWRRICKRATDIVLTILGVIVISPLLAFVAIAIKLQDGGPVISRQTRIGRNGEPFTMFKFRSMVVDAEARWEALIQSNEGHGGLFKLAHDPGVTWLGHFLREFSLDELPQLFNVLRGNMSLVGPRPHVEHETALMHTAAVRRSLVNPGLTGLWQISGRSDISCEDSLRLDLRYVENWSFTLDLLILWRTLFALTGQLLDVVHRSSAAPTPGSGGRRGLRRDLILVAVARSAGAGRRPGPRKKSTGV